MEKGRIFANYLENARLARGRLGKPPKEAKEDDLQRVLIINDLLDKELGSLIEAYQVLLDERSHLERLIVEEGRIESLDDLELVGQYIRTIRDTNLISRKEIARLTEALEANTVVPKNSANFIEEDQRRRDALFQQMIKEIETLKLVKVTSEPLPACNLASLETSLVNLHAKNLALEAELAEAKRRLDELEIQPELVSESKTTSSSALRSEQLSSTCLRDELELMTQELRRLQTANQNMEYARNVLVKFLAMPDQRKALVRVLAALFKIDEIPPEFQ